MSVVERGQEFLVIEEIGKGYTFVIPLRKDCIAIDPDLDKPHNTVAAEAGF